MKYRSKKGTVINIPDGLGPKQIQAIKDDADAGYGTRAQERANELGKKLSAAPATPAVPKSTEQQIARTQAEIDKRGGPEKAPNYAARLAELQGQLPGQNTGNTVDNGVMTGGTTTGGTDPNGTLTPEGYVDQETANRLLEEQRKKDAEEQFKRDNPDEEDEFGNKITYTMGPDGKPIRTVTQGETAKKFREWALAAASSYDGEADRKAAYDAEFANRTKYLDRNQSRDLEQTKQELAERGIPYDPAAEYDPNTKNLYGKTVGAVREDYKSQYTDAANQATILGNQAYATTASAKNAYLNSVMGGSNVYGSDFRDYVNNVRAQSGDDSMALLSMSADQYAKLRGISVQEAESLRNDALAKKQLQEQKRANKAGERLTAAGIAKSGGGGGGGGGSSDAGAGFEIIS
jgi:hypothetical protein